MNFIGDYAPDQTVYVYFDSFTSAGASVTMTAFVAADIEIYNNADMVQRTSDAGYTLIDTDGIDIDGRVGIHGFSIDLSDDTDTDFYQPGNDYTIVVDAVTIDGNTVRFVAGQFSICNRAPYNTGNGVLFQVEADAGNSDSQMQTNLAEATNDHYIGKLVTMLTGALAGATVQVTDYDGTDGILTHGSWPSGETPATNDWGVLT